MIVAIMQPYFLPYIGYFQLMKAVNVFVIYDDAQYMKGGWINRNRIRIGDRSAWLTLPVRHASVKRPINQREYRFSGAEAVRYLVDRLRTSYAASPHWDEIVAPGSAWLKFDANNIATCNARQLEGIARGLGVDCRFVVSSGIEKPADLRGQARVIDLCRRVGASHYINPIGGASLYDRAAFEAAAIELSFLRTSARPTMLRDGPEHLSIIDGLMNEGFAGCGRMLNHYVLQPAAAGPQPA